MFEHITLALTLTLTLTLTRTCCIAKITYKDSLIFGSKMPFNTQKSLSIITRLEVAQRGHLRHNKKKINYPFYKNYLVGGSDNYFTLPPTVQLDK